VTLKSRLVLVASFVLASALLAVTIEWGHSDAWACVSGSSYRADVWTSALRAMTRPSKDTLAIAIAVSPTLLAIALARRPWLQIIAFAPMTVALVLLLHHLGIMNNFDVRSMHTCDRKGCTACFGLFVWIIFMQLPVGTLLLIGLGLQRLKEAVSHGRASG
jgi:hypothetical protein